MLGTERLYSHLTYQVFYSDSQDHTQPIIAFVSAQRGQGASVRFEAVVNDDSDVGRVVATYTDGQGQWQSLELVHDASTGRWAGELPSMPGELLYLVQAVDAAGNVALTAAKGHLYGLLAADVRADRLQIAEGEAIAFEVTPPAAIGTVQTTSWYFGDGLSASDVLTPTHHFRDSGVYTVTATIVGESGSTAVGSVVVMVTNLPPQLEVGGQVTSDAGRKVILPNATLFDPGALDTHTATVQWGDGGSAEPAQVTQQPGPPGSADGMRGLIAFPPHTYASEGVYVVTVCVRDDEGAETCRTLQAVTQGFANRVWLPAYKRLH